FRQRLVRFGEIDILADHADAHMVLGVANGFDQAFPHGEVGRGWREGQRVADDGIQTLLVQHARNLVDGRFGVPDGDHGIKGNIREQGDLRALFVGDATVGTTQEGIRINADLTQFLHGMLGGLGLQFAGRADVGHEGEVNEGGIIAAQAQAHLTHGLEEGQRRAAAHRTADLDNGDVGGTIPGGLRTAHDEILDLVRDVRYDLHRLAKVIAPPFLAQHRLVDLPGGEVVHLAHAGGNETLVVAEVQVGFGAVFRHEHFAVLEGAHGTGVDVDVGVELEHRDAQAAGFQDRCQRGGSNAFTQGGDDASRDEYVLGHVGVGPGVAGRCWKFEL